MNKELLANIRNILIPTLASRLKKTNYEGQGEKDAIEFTHDMTEIFDLAERQLSAHPNWIPVTERLPEEDTEVLISYRYKDGEGDTNHVYIDITTYGQMYFGGNKVGVHKLWRAPFEYFGSNYEVIAWMPLPEPYRGEKNENRR